jgi:hypothetical protein
VISWFGQHFLERVLKIRAQDQYQNNKSSFHPAIAQLDYGEGEERG